MPTIKEIKTSIKTLGDLKKFSLTEACSDITGKTSAGNTCGIITVVLSTLCFTYGCIIRNTDIITNSTLMTSLGCALLGIKGIMQGKPIPDTTTTTTTDNPDETDN